MVPPQSEVMTESSRLESSEIIGQKKTEKELNLFLKSWDKHTCISKSPGSLCEALKDTKLSKSVPDFHCLSYAKMLHLMKINQDNFPSIDTITLCTCTESFM